MDNVTLRSMKSRRNIHRSSLRYDPTRHSTFNIQRRRTGSAGEVGSWRGRQIIGLVFPAVCAAILWAGQAGLRAETPGEFRPVPFENPTEKVGASGDKVQPANTLPKSRAPLLFNPQHNVLPAKSPELRGNDLIFNADWKMIEAPNLKEADGARLSATGIDVREWHDAVVPGTVLTTLVNDGVYPDPYFGLNNLLIPESLNRQDYWYRLAFQIPKNFAQRELWLDFNGINFYAEAWLNGHYLGHITGAFTRGKFDVTRWIDAEGPNVLAVMVAPAPDPGLPTEQSVAYGPGDNGGRLSLDGPTFVCTEGWDWIPGIRDRDTGIWQDVILRASGPVSIADPQVVTSLPLPDISRAEVSVTAELNNASDSVQAGVLKGAFEGVTFEQPVSLSPGETKTVSFTPPDYGQLVVRHPRLWWPNGYGKPELYHLNLKFVTAGKKISDETALRFGMRELSYELTVKETDGKKQRVEYIPTVARGGSPVIDNRRYSLGWRDLWGDDTKLVAVWPGMENSPALKPLADEAMGPYLVVKVNGQRIFCNGGNWGMDDAMKRISRERLEPYVRLHRDANLTMIRNWAGQSTSETFYDLCDEYGLLIWNDFWMNTEGWNYSPLNHELFLTNVADTIKRFRNHPSIAVWCARNEGVPPEEINQGNDRLIRELDGTRYYQPNSRLINLRTSGPWDRQPLEKYFTDLNHGFSTEMGAPSIPSAEVLRTMMPAADLWPPGDVWAYHDFHSKGALRADELMRQIARCYGEARNLDEFCAKAQLVNYETYRAIYEGFDSRLWHDCSGVLFWMSHPSWPSVVWQLYSWDYEPNASFFGAKKAGEPVHIQMNLPDCEVAVVNHRSQPLVDACAKAVIYDLAGHKVQEREIRLGAAGDAVTNLFALDWPADGTYLAKLTLTAHNGDLLSDNFYWHARQPEQLQSLNTLAKTSVKGRLHTSTRGGQTVLECKLSNPSQTPVLAIKLTVRDADTGLRVLPVYYGDNYVSLLPGETRRIHIECGPVAHPEVTLDGWNVKPTTIEGGVF